MFNFFHFAQQSPSQIYVRRICNFLEVYASLVPYSPKEGAFILVAPSLETSCFPCRGPRVSTISFWISASMFWFFIRRSKTADLVWNLIYIILDIEFSWLLTIAVTFGYLHGTLLGIFREKGNDGVGSKKTNLS